MKNEKGVVIHLIPKTKGINLKLAGEGVKLAAGENKVALFCEVPRQGGTSLLILWHCMGAGRRRRNEQGRRPVHGGTGNWEDPHWKDHLLFYEYFHGDNGAGLGASHQTGWAGLVGKLIQLYGYLDPQKFLEAGREAAFQKD